MANNGEQEPQYLENKIKCPICGDWKNKTRKFYLSNKLDYDTFDHRCFYCIDCLNEMCFNKSGIPDVDGFKNVLKNYLDRPFFLELYKKSLEDSRATLGAYNSRLNTGTYKNKDLRWKDGETEEKEEIDKQLKEKVKKEIENSTNSIEIIHGNLDEYENIGVDELRDRWGSAYPLEDLVWLEKKNLEWYDGYDIQGKSMELLVQQLCFEEFYIYKERQKGEDVSKRIKTLQDLLKNSNLSPRQETASDQAEFQTISEFIKKVEERRPFIKSNPEFEDVDNFRGMWKSMAGAISRTAGKSDENTKVFENFFKDSTMDFSNLIPKEED